MRHDFRRKQLARSIPVLILLMTFLSTSLGCEPLRKKFTRKKVENKKYGDEFIPILDPVDYPAKIYSSEDLYKKHYSQWKIWQDELIVSMNESATDKKLKFLINQLIVQVESMMNNLSEEKRKELEPILNDYRLVKDALEKPEGVRRTYSLKYTVESNGKKIRHDFNPKNLLSYKQEIAEDIK